MSGAEWRGQDYTPESIDRWLRQWDLLVSLAESPRTSVHHLQFGHNHKSRDGISCQTGPRMPGGRPNDGLSWALVQADLEAAAASLPMGSLERQVVYARIRGGGSLSQIARVLRTRRQHVTEAHARAIAMMASHLGWVPDEEIA